MKKAIIILGLSLASVVNATEVKPPLDIVETSQAVMEKLRETCPTLLSMQFYETGFANNLLNAAGELPEVAALASAMYKKARAVAELQRALGCYSQGEL